MRFSLLFVLVALTACQPVPKPFSHQGAPPRELLRLRDSRSVAVLPLTDRAGHPLEFLTKQMVTALQGQEVPASYGSGGKTSYLLLGRFTVSPAPPALVWSLQTPQGDLIGRVAQPLGKLDGQSASEAEQAGFERAARQLAALLHGEQPREVVEPPLYVGEVAGAPGDGNTRLRAAIGQILPRAGLQLTPRSTADSLVVTGAVSVAAPHDGEQLVSIAWTVWDPYGAEVGTIAQKRSVAAGSLDANWGLVANEAALAGAAGIAQMIHQIDWSQGFQPPQ